MLPIVPFSAIGAVDNNNIMSLCKVSARHAIISCCGLLRFPSVYTCQEQSGIKAIQEMHNDISCRTLQLAGNKKFKAEHH